MPGVVAATRPFPPLSSVASLALSVVEVFSPKALANTANQGLIYWFIDSLDARKCNRVQPRGEPQIGICNEVQKSLEIIGSTPQGHTCRECWQLWFIVGGAGNGAAEEDWCWDLNLGTAVIRGLFLRPHFFSGTMKLGRLLAPHGLRES